MTHMFLSLDVTVYHNFQTNFHDLKNKYINKFIYFITILSKLIQENMFEKQKKIRVIVRQMHKTY